MRIPLASALVLAIAFVAMPAAAQTMPTFTQAYQARIALGESPASWAEADGWNVVQKVRLAHATGNETAITLRVPDGMQVGTATCSCGAVASEQSGSSVTVRIPAATASGDHDVELPASQQEVKANPAVPGSTAPAFAPALHIPAGRESDAAVIVYVPDTYTLQRPVAADSELRCTENAPCTIVTFVGSAARPLPSPFQPTLEPKAATPPDTPSPSPDMMPWLYAAVAFVLGCVVWAMLVRAGAVQRKTRKQVVATAAHEEIAAKETAPVLEGKKRALMAALKDVELAHQGREMDDATYDAVKADFKRQAVNVMRALETVEAEKKAE